MHFNSLLNLTGFTGKAHGILRSAPPPLKLVLSPVDVDNHGSIHSFGSG